MDLIIKHIIDIDKRANDIMSRTQQRIEESERDTKDSIVKMRTDIIKDAKVKANELHDSVIQEAMLEAEKIRVSSEEDCIAIESKFACIKEAFEEKIFDQIINTNMRDNRE